MTSPTLEELGLRGPESAYRRAEAELTLRRRARAWVGAHRRSLLLAGAALVVVGVVHGWGVGHAPALNDDEGTYMSQAWAVLHEHRLEVYTYWYDHPPFGWIQIAFYLLVTGPLPISSYAVVDGRVLMVLLALLSGGLLYLLARRLAIRRAFATGAVLLFGLSPLAVDYQRMVFLDNVAVPWLLAALALAASPRRSLWAAAASGACFAASVMSKETFLLFAPALLLLVWVRSHRKTRAFCLTAVVTTFSLLVVAYPLYALLKGELFPGKGHVSLWQGITFQLSSRPGSGSVFVAGTNANNTVSGWAALDPWLLAIGLAAAVACLLSRRYRPFSVAMVVPILVALRGGYLPGPFVIGLLPIAALCTAALLEMVTVRLTRRHRGGRVPAHLLAAGMLAALAVAWIPGDRALTHQDTTTPVFQAESWIEAHVPRDKRIIVDNTLWNDLIDHGFSRQLGVVWFQKLDFTENLDPSVARALPGGWRDFAYIVSTPALRSSLATSPSGFVPVRQALQHSVVVASFGRLGGLVQVRRITGPGPLATLAHGRKETSHQ